MSESYIPFFRSYAEFYWRLGSEAQKSGYIDMILDYAFNGKEPALDNPMYGVFTLIRPNIDASLALRAQRAAAGAKRSAAKGHAGNKFASKTERKQNENRTGTERNQKGKGKGEGVGEYSLLSNPNGLSNSEYTPPSVADAREGDDPQADDEIIQRIRPSLEECLEAAKRRGYDPEWVKRWYADIKERDFTYISRGSTVSVNRRNYITVMVSFHNRDKDKARQAATTQPQGTTLPVADDFDFSRINGCNPDGSQKED